MFGEVASSAVLQILPESLRLLCFIIILPSPDFPLAFLALLCSDMSALQTSQIFLPVVFEILFPPVNSLGK
jgi:hypothetical protein